MKTRQISPARMSACGLALLGSVAAACDASVDALGSSGSELSTIYPNAEECPAEPTEEMTNNDEFGDVTELDRCTGVTPGTVCAYDVRDSSDGYQGWAAYVCGCTVQGKWKSVGTTIEGYACPDRAPPSGAPCDALPGPCPYYPNQQAYCVDGAWQYYEPGPRYPCPELDNTLYP
jgi:hypothetical protein